MRRGSTGQYEITRSAGEQVRAFVPQPLPPEPAVDLSNARQRLLERATLALGRLDSITLLLDSIVMPGRKGPRRGDARSCGLDPPALRAPPLGRGE